jgi:plastocyanin
MTARRVRLIAIATVFCLICAAQAQEIAFTARIAWAGKKYSGKTQSGSRVALWLMPEENAASPVAPSGANRPRLVQRNKTFEPHLLVVPVDTVVEFPNRDPFFHNVFSMFEGKRFDLGLYEAGTTREVHFTRPGVSFIFCNIHPEMSAVVIAVATPYFATSSEEGEVVIPNVPAGRYRMHLWYEGASQEELDSQEREVTVSERNSSLGVLHLRAPGAVRPHKNKYGRDYDPPVPDSPGYRQP